jgi:hypothetical protein
MSGKTGRKPTARKPLNVRRQGSKTDGAFGKETVDQIVAGDVEQNLDKAVRRRARR